MTTSTPLHPRTWLAATSAFVALTAFGGAVGLIGGGLRLTSTVESRLPFHSPVVGGLALALLVGVPFTVLAVQAWRGSQSAGFLACIVGVMLAGWIIVELAFIREFSFFHPLYLAIGAAFAIVGWRTRSQGRDVVSVSTVQEFLARPRIAVVGASGVHAKFGYTVFSELRDHGHDVVPVNPRALDIDGQPCLASIDQLPGDVDAAIIMLSGDAAADAVSDCAAHGIRYVWLFRGAGEGAVNERTLAICREHGIVTVPGACPLMFLQPVSGVHKAHLRMRCACGAVDDAP